LQAPHLWGLFFALFHAKAHTPDGGNTKIATFE